ncbi:hypothetical protein QBC40DRAFT_292387 [Triangularia verruculosa]|uniref:Uncharacterized protein n=1 Tax=Triangularia verruculosa TaxID=2587418 RepID=A0AAN6XQT4_9PEZI|nr:hypothetical protein QBC40DRAFT_292387 [Triangularia verruculosa]
MFMYETQVRQSLQAEMRALQDKQSIHLSIPSQVDSMSLEDLKWVAATAAAIVPGLCISEAQWGEVDVGWGRVRIQQPNGPVTRVLGNSADTREGRWGGAKISYLGARLTTSVANIDTVSSASVSTLWRSLSSPTIKSPLQVLQKRSPSAMSCATILEKVTVRLRGSTVPQRHQSLSWRHKLLSPANTTKAGTPVPKRSTRMEHHLSCLPSQEAKIFTQAPGLQKTSDQYTQFLEAGKKINLPAIKAKQPKRRRLPPIASMAIMKALRPRVIAAGQLRVGTGSLAALGLWRTVTFDTGLSCFRYGTRRIRFTTMMKQVKPNFIIYAYFRAAVLYGEAFNQHPGVRPTYSSLFRASFYLYTTITMSSCLSPEDKIREVHEFSRFYEAVARNPDYLNDSILDSTEVQTVLQAVDKTNSDASLDYIQKLNYDMSYYKAVRGQLSYLLHMAKLGLLGDGDSDLASITESELLELWA